MIIISFNETIICSILLSVVAVECVSQFGDKLHPTVNQHSRKEIKIANLLSHPEVEHSDHPHKYIPPIDDHLVSDSYKDEQHYHEPKYNYEYVVQDEYSGNHYGKQESRDGHDVTGSYFVLLPDGRKQIVNYYVKGDSGFVAEVTYEGEAHNTVDHHKLSTHHHQTSTNHHQPKKHNSIHQPPTHHHRQPKKHNSIHQPPTHHHHQPKKHNSIHQPPTHHHHQPKKHNSRHQPSTQYHEPITHHQTHLQQPTIHNKPSHEYIQPISHHLPTIQPTKHHQPIKHHKPTKYHQQPTSHDIPVQHHQEPLYIEDNAYSYSNKKSVKSNPTSFGSRLSGKNDQSNYKAPKINRYRPTRPKLELKPSPVPLNLHNHGHGKANPAIHSPPVYTPTPTYIRPKIGKWHLLKH